MSANQVIDKIVSEANAEAEQIKADAAKAAAAGQQQFQKELDSYNQQTKQLEEKTLEEIKSQTLAAARMEIAKESLKVRNQILDETFNLAAEKIKNMAAEDYQQLMEKMIISAVSSGTEEVVIDKNENRIDSAFIERVNAKLSADGKGSLKLSETRADIGAGFILQKGKVRSNASLKVMMAAAKENLQTELAAELFN